MILDALRQGGGVQARAAKILGISERSLWYRVKKLGIQVRTPSE
jgi:two-component system NtrC family response regulator